MAKPKTVFFCQSCGYQSPKWLGKCPSCGSWNSFAEEIIHSTGKNKG
ncbi:MAG: DNA repair protein RadA, partial [Candidatus Moranbacteria bacterium]|nr:DNA repair protein RadA [Candidatus Moranbacteria bacterium]